MERCAMQVRQDAGDGSGESEGAAAGGFEIRSLMAQQEMRQPYLRLVSQLVAEKGGVNLGQGVCQMPTPRIVKRGAMEATARGWNRYSPPDGILPLREKITAKLQRFNGIPCEVGHVAVTCGSTGAFEAVCETFLNPGDEVVMFAPIYPYHRNTVEHGGRCAVKTVRLAAPNWTFDFDEFRAALGPKTKIVLLVNPGNPTGKVFTREELLAVGGECRRRGILVVTDEVYEYLTYGGRRHLSIASLPGMFDSTITMGSYSKTFSITGWRIGYLCAPAAVLPSVKALLDQRYICPPTNNQYGVLRGLESLGDDFYERQRLKYARKRKILCSALEAAGFAVCKPQGAYYVIADISRRFPGLTSEEVAIEKLINAAAPGEAVGAVPASDFLGREVLGDPERSTFLRFCYSAPDESLKKAAALIEGLSGNRG
ncbi:MAG TPA: pyridoxal phosphate-dependent aminotransferase [Planctomycetia bacterium]|nr:pyridoxal phosphate-dependent aminotransferase [Planctomycetia bacterium]